MSQSLIANCPVEVLSPMATMGQVSVFTTLMGWHGVIQCEDGEFRMNSPILWQTGTRGQILAGGTHEVGTFWVSRGHHLTLPFGEVQWPGKKIALRSGTGLSAASAEAVLCDGVEDVPLNLTTSTRQIFIEQMEPDRVPTLACAVVFLVNWLHHEI